MRVFSALFDFAPLNQLEEEPIGVICRVTGIVVDEGQFVEAVTTELQQLGYRFVEYDELEVWASISDSDFDQWYKQQLREISGGGLLFGEFHQYPYD